jgi:hypothetical protein
MSSTGSDATTSQALIPLHDDQMDEILGSIAVARGGYMFRGDLIDHGFRDKDIKAAVRAGLLTKLRHGTYAPTEPTGAMTPGRRHFLIACSVADKLGDSVVISNVSAAAGHGCDIYGLDLDNVHLTRLDGKHGRTEAGVTFHVSRTDSGLDVVEIDGRQTVTPVRAVLETACSASVESGMIVASSAIRLKLFSQAELSDALPITARWRGARRANLASRLADGRLESVGEVRSLHMMWQHGVPLPELQFELVVEGRTAARVDFAWLPDRHTGEFDGLMKYGRLNPYSKDVGKVLVGEKRREDIVREEMLGMTRWTWGDLAPRHRSFTADRINRGRETSRKLYARNVVYIPLR